MVALPKIGVLAILPIVLVHALYGADQSDVTSEPLLLARLKQHSGEYRAARDILSAALSKAPNCVSLLNQLGSVEQDLGEYWEAERSYLRALSVSASSRGDLERIVVLINLATLYLDTDQYSKGERVREQLAILRPETLKRSPVEAGTFLNVMGSLEHMRNHDDEAKWLYSRSLLLLRQANNVPSIDAALVEANLGFVQMDSRQYQSAAVLFERAIHEIEIASGPDDPALIRPLVNLARCKNMTHQPNPAEMVARRAVELSVKIFGEGHPVTATAILEEAAALSSLRQKKRAHDLEKRANDCLRNSVTHNRSEYTVNVRGLTSAAHR